MSRSGITLGLRSALRPSPEVDFTRDFGRLDCDPISRYQLADSGAPKVSSLETASGIIGIIDGCRLYNVGGGVGLLEVVNAKTLSPVVDSLYELAISIMPAQHWDM